MNGDEQMGCPGPSINLPHRYVINRWNGLDTEWIEDNGERLLYALALRGHIEPDVVTLLFTISNDEAQRISDLDRMHDDLNRLLTEICSDGRRAFIRRTTYEEANVTEALAKDWSDGGEDG